MRALLELVAGRIGTGSSIIYAGAQDAAADVLPRAYRRRPRGEDLPCCTFGVDLADQFPLSLNLPAAACFFLRTGLPGRDGAAYAIGVPVTLTPSV